jgi:hypothetical protein
LANQRKERWLATAASFGVIPTTMLILWITAYQATPPRKKRWWLHSCLDWS